MLMFEQILYYSHVYVQKEIDQKVTHCALRPTASFLLNLRKAMLLFIPVFNIYFDNVLSVLYFSQHSFCFTVLG